MDYTGLGTGEYWANVEDMRTSIMRDAIVAKAEAQTAEAFQRQLYYYIRLNTGVELDFKQETYDKKNATHQEICKLSKKASKTNSDSEIKNIQKKLSELYLMLCEKK